MPLNGEDAAIWDQGQCVFFGVFCGGCYLRSGGSCERERARQTKPDKQDGEGTETETVRTSSSTASHHL